MIIVFSIKMKNDIVLSYYWMKGAHLVEDNIHTRTWSFDSINCMYEHAMHKFLESYQQLVHG